MKPLDPRLLRFARSTRGFIALAVVLGVITAVLVILQARLLSDAIVSVTADDADWADVQGTVVAVGLVFAARALVSWMAEVGAVRSSARAKQELRSAAIDHVLALGPAGPTAQDPGATDVGLAAQAYDSVVLVALAAEVANGTTGHSIAAALPGVG